MTVQQNNMNEREKLMQMYEKLQVEREKQPNMN